MAASMCNVLRRVYVCRKPTCLTSAHQAFYSNGAAIRENDENRDFRLQVFRKKPNTFAAMFRQSQLAQMGDLKDKLIYGTVETIRGDDLYIDFGGKFNCVCPRPARHGELYKKGTVVRLLLHDMEMTSSFLGSDKHVTLLEADATLLGLKGVNLRKIQPQNESTVIKTDDAEVTAESISDMLMTSTDNVEIDFLSDDEAIEDENVTS